jgi:integrase
MYLSERSNGFYYILFINEKGKRNRISTKCRKKSDALKFLMNFRDGFIKPKEEKLPQMSLTQFKNYILKYSAAMHSYKTGNTYLNSANFLIKYFGDVELSSITHQKMSEYFVDRLKSGSIYEARKDLINLSASFNRAFSDEYIKINPCISIKRFRLPERMPIFFTQEDFSKLLEDISSNVIKNLVILAFNTGMRQMEMLQ